MWFAGKWMELEDIMVREVSQAQKDKDHMFALICGRWTQYKCSSLMKNRSCYGEVTNRRRRVKEGS
jgi:hypothetical protein